MKAALDRLLGRAGARDAPTAAARGQPPRLRVLFVCMGNICRSPTAHGVFRRQLRAAGLEGAVAVASAGTHGGGHAGEPPDPRALKHARARGVDIADLRARALAAEDIALADWLVVMDAQNEQAVLDRCAPHERAKVVRLTAFCRRDGAHAGADEVPDPYYGGPAGFEHVLDLVEDGCSGLLAAVRARL